MAPCPGHADRTPSLHITATSDRILLKCHAGCSTDAILSAMGLVAADLFFGKSSASGHRGRIRRAAPPASYSPKRAGAMPDGRNATPATRYELRDLEGRVVAVHVRKDRPGGKKMWWQRPDGSDGLGGLRTADLPLYGAHVLRDRPNELVIVVEGEKAAQTLLDTGRLAVGTVTGAAGTPSDNALRPLVGRDVAVWRDNDDPGLGHMQRVAAAILRLGGRCRWSVEWTEAPAGGDAADFVAQHGAGEALDALLASAAPCVQGQPSPADLLRDAGHLSTPSGTELVDAASTGLAASDPVPWPDAVDGGRLVEIVAAFFTRYAVLPTGAAVVLALWTIATWSIDVFDAFPYLAATSPQKRCGKTRLIELLMLVVKRALALAGISEAALFRVIEKERPTLLIDEAQHLRSRDERSAALHDLLCAGTRRPTAYVCRIGGRHRDELQRFSVFCPKAIALIGKLTDVLTDRAIEVPMRRRKSGERVARFFFAQASAESEPVRRQIARWAADHQDEVREAYLGSPLPDWLEDREAELWAPLLAVARVAIAERVVDVEKIVKKMSSAKAETDDSIGVRLLADVRIILDGQEFLPTKDIVAALVAIEDAPWSEYRAGKPIAAKGLADLLKPFGIEPGKARYEGQAGVRGYFRQAFQDAWERYLPTNPPDRPQAPQPPQPLQDKGQSGIPDMPPSPSVADSEMPEDASMTRVVARVAGSNPPGGNEADLEDRVEADPAGALTCLRALAEAREWPRIYIGCGETIPADPEAWARFIDTAPADGIAWAIADLESLEVAPS